jgi:Xaa-Pro dipeptidase
LNRSSADSGPRQCGQPPGAPSMHIDIAVDYIRKLGASIRRIGIETSFLPSDAKDALARSLGGVEFREAHLVLERLRAIKSPAELDMVREASERVVASMLATFAAARPGMTKQEIVDRLRQEEQARDLVFEYCLIAAGSSHNRAPSNQVLNEGDIISLDSGGNYKSYIGDLSRMGILGEPDAELVSLLREVEDIQQEARRAVVPGTPGAAIMAAGQGRVAASPHRKVIEFTAHGIGLVSHEAPRLTDTGPVPYPPYDADRPLEPGMVISIETALLHPQRGYVKLEDTVIVTPDGWDAPGDGGRGWNVSPPGRGAP